MKIVIFWKTRDEALRNRIKAYFHISGMTINKEAVADITPGQRDKFYEGEKLGYYEITQRPIPKWHTEQTLPIQMKSSETK